MSEELRPCPYCLEQPIEKVSKIDGVTYYSCGNRYTCPASGWFTADEWNNRPIEDALRARAERAEKMVERLIEVGERLRDYAILVSADHPMGDGQMALKDKSMWEYLVAECKESQLVTNAYKLKETK